jgi:ring-1,2-phenylacetyl-CoA epoxidase subunit PaaB
MGELSPLWEVFVRGRRGLDHVHVGEGASIWVVESRHICASQESDVAAFYDPMDDKPYRHATHYTLPDGVDNM